jgi:acylpyruvate hydrolase
VRVATVRLEGSTRAVRVDDERAIEIEGVADVGELLADPEWRRRARDASGATHDLDALDYAPVVPRPDKIVCVGLNYRSHILEMGRPVPEAPTLFAKFSAALLGANDPIVLPSVSHEVDWEAELGVIIGRNARAVSGDQARNAIAGFCVVNDVTVRDWQHRTTQWLAGKTFESTTPLGPCLVTPDDAAIAGRAGFELTCEVDGVEVQRASTTDLVFDPVALVGFLSTIITLNPGDVIATGTPGGVGHARTPPQYLGADSRLVTRIEGIGECVNTCVMGE